MKSATRVRQALEFPPQATPPAAHALSFSGVTKSYMRGAARALLRHRLRSWFKPPAESFVALDDVSFALPAGQSLAIVGGNGAGKSTLLRLACGITPPDQGRIQVRGTIAALMELGAGFHPDLTGAENVMLNAALLGIGRKQTYEQFEEIVEFSGIGEFIHEPLRTYSSGMMLRLAFAVAMRLSPDVLFIDEVLSVGDQGFQEKCIEEIRRLKTCGKSLVCVSHGLEVLRELCDQALWLEHGRVRMVGPAAAVLDAYQASGHHPIP